MDFKLTADIVFTGGSIITVDKSNTIHTGLAVKGNKILLSVAKRMQKNLSEKKQRSLTSPVGASYPALLILTFIRV